MAIPARIEIPLFPDAKRFAFTTSWDDGQIHDRRIISSFNEWGIKGTFNLNSGILLKNKGVAGSTFIAPEEVATLYTGHEVAVHTVTHPWLEKLDASQIAWEVLEDRRILEDLAGYPIRGMAYPFGTYNQQVINVLRALGIVYSRTVENKWNNWPVSEPLAWAATCHQFNMDEGGPVERFKKWAENPRNSGLIYIWGHSYEFDRGNCWERLEQVYKPFSGRQDTWYCTNIELFDYEEARKRIVIAANRKTAFNPSALPVTLKADGKVLSVPAGKTIALDV